MTIINTLEFNSGDIVQHFKRELISRTRPGFELMHVYVITGRSIHTETGEELIQYRALYPPYQTFSRPTSMFYSKVDKSKYPNVKQTYRLEKVSKELDEWIRVHRLLPDMIASARYTKVVDDKDYSELICKFVDGSERIFHFHKNNPMPKIDNIIGYTWEQLCGMCTGIWRMAIGDCIQLYDLVSNNVTIGQILEQMMEAVRTKDE